MISDNIAEELAYLRFFYDQINISPQERAYIQEGYELCFNKKVPEAMKIGKSNFPIKERIPAIPPPPNVPNFSRILELIDTSNYDVVDKVSGENISLSMLIDKLKILNKK